jgi:hypothetical protein
MMEHVYAQGAEGMITERRSKLANQVISEL